MLTVGAVDLSAESRQRLQSRIDTWVRWDSGNAGLLPGLSVIGSSLDEIKFRAEMALCFIGPDIIAFDAVQVAGIRKALPRATLIAVLDSRIDSSSVVEQLARFGVDDIVNEKTSSDEAVKKLVLWSAKQPARTKGQCIVVESGKGGVGVTSYVAGLGEALLEQGKSVVLVDWDFETQDLSRFLEAKPFMNETLRTILDSRQPLTEDSLAPCVTKVWEDEDDFVVVPPPAHITEQAISAANTMRVFANVQEALAHSYDFVIVDCATLPASLRRILYAIPGVTILSLVNDDPASAHAACLRTSLARSVKHHEARILLQPYGTVGMNYRSLVDEVMKSSGLSDDSVLKAIPWSAKAAAWPASGSTVFSRCRKARAAFSEITPVITGEANTLPIAVQGTMLFAELWRWLTIPGIISRKDDAKLQLPIPQPARCLLPEKTLDEFVSRAQVDNS